MKVLEHLAERKVSKQAQKASQGLLEFMQQDKNQYRVKIGRIPFVREPLDYMQEVADSTIELLEETTPTDAIRYDRFASTEISKRIVIGALGLYGYTYAARPTLVFAKTNPN